MAIGKASRRSQALGEYFAAKNDDEVSALDST